MARLFGLILALAGAAAPGAGHASFLSGETLDTAANMLSWLILFLVPCVAIAVFLYVHVLPEVIAERNQHPHKHSIKVLCILSLFFGGMLWPVAWLWAYSKPVMFKLAYGTDVDDSHGTPPGVVEPSVGTIPVLTTEAEVPAATRAAKQGA